MFPLHTRRKTPCPACPACVPGPFSCRNSRPPARGGQAVSLGVAWSSLRRSPHSRLGRGERGPRNRLRGPSCRWAGRRAVPVPRREDEAGRSLGPVGPFPGSAEVSLGFDPSRQSHRFSHHGWRLPPQLPLEQVDGTDYAKSELAVRVPREAVFLVRGASGPFCSARIPSLPQNATARLNSLVSSPRRTTRN